MRFEECWSLLVAFRSCCGLDNCRPYEVPIRVSRDFNSSAVQVYLSAFVLCGGNETCYTSFGGWGYNGAPVIRIVFVKEGHQEKDGWNRYTNKSAPFSKPPLTFSFCARSISSGSHDWEVPTRTTKGSTESQLQFNSFVGMRETTNRQRWPCIAGQQLHHADQQGRSTNKHDYTHLRTLHRESNSEPGSYWLID